MIGLNPSCPEFWEVLANLSGHKFEQPNNGETKSIEDLLLDTTKSLAAFQSIHGLTELTLAKLPIFSGRRRPFFPIILLFDYVLHIFQGGLYVSLFPFIVSQWLLVNTR